MIKNDKMLEACLKQMEKEIRQGIPGWDEDRRWKFIISEKTGSKRDMIDYDKKIILVGAETFEIAYSGNQAVREEMLSYLFSIIRVLRIIDQ